MRAGSKVQNICKRINGVFVITNLKKMAKNRPSARTFFCFTRFLIPLANNQHLGFVEEGSVEWFETEICSLRFLQVLSNLLWKLAIYFAIWKLFFRWDISMNKSANFTASMYQDGFWKFPLVCTDPLSSPPPYMYIGELSQSLNELTYYVFLWFLRITVHCYDSGCHRQSLHIRHVLGDLCFHCRVIPNSHQASKPSNFVAL